MIEAMKQALEVLKFTGNIWHMDCKKDEAITSLRQAIAEAEQDEPVAWFWFDERDGGEWIHIADNQIDANKFGDVKIIPLYTHPQPRTWVELTQEETYELWQASRCGVPRYSNFASLINAKLKEKKT